GGGGLAFEAQAAVLHRDGGDRPARAPLVAVPVARLRCRAAARPVGSRPLSKLTKLPDGLPDANATAGRKRLATASSRANRAGAADRRSGRGLCRLLHQRAVGGQRRGKCLSDARLASAADVKRRRPHHWTERSPEQMIQDSMGSRCDSGRGATAPAPHTPTPFLPSNLTRYIARPAPRKRAARSVP